MHSAWSVPRGANPVRQARPKVNAVAPLEFLVHHPARRLEREFNRALENERELVFVVIAEPIGPRGNDGQQRLEVSPHELFRERPTLLAVAPEGSGAAERFRAAVIRISLSRAIT